VTYLPEAADPPVAAFGRAADALLAAARTGRAHACDAAFGLRVTEVLAAVEEELGRSTT
jgi:hypothetical protein